MIDGYNMRLRISISTGIKYLNLFMNAGFSYIDYTISKDTDFIHHPSFNAKSLFISCSYTGERFNVGLKFLTEFIKAKEWLGFGNWADGEGMNMYIIVYGAGIN